MESGAGADPAVQWAFQAPNAPDPPSVESPENARRVLNPIDHFVLNRLKKAGLEPAPEATPETLVRRAYFDLLGLPPSPEQVEAFVQDNSLEAWSDIVDELLASQHDGERWARHWLDVARYADSGGYEPDIH